MTPGKDRLDAAARTYLDGCLRDRGVKALLLEARGHLPIAEEVMRRNRMTVDVVAADFTALGWPHPRQAARLWIAATAVRWWNSNSVAATPTPARCSPLCPMSLRSSHRRSLGLPIVKRACAVVG